MLTVIKHTRIYIYICIYTLDVEPLYELDEVHEVKKTERNTEREKSKRKKCWAVTSLQI